MLIDALRDATLSPAAIRALVDQAADSTPRETWLALVRDATLPRLARRLAVRRLLESAWRPGATLAEVGAWIAADAWLAPADVRHVAVLGGKIPVRWLPEDRVVVIDVCPALPGDGDRHRLLVYLRVAGHPPVDRIVAELRGGTSGTSLEVREVGFFETEMPRAIPPELLGVVLCRRALCDAATGMHTLVDVLIDVAVSGLPGSAMFDVYLQLRRLTGATSLVLEVLDATRPGEPVVLATGTLALGAAPSAPDTPAPPSLGVAIPNVTATFAHPGEHRLRVRCGDESLGEHGFVVVAAGGA
jgi:hypothetical protein